MDIQETAKLLNIVVNGCPVELIQYIDGLLNESNKTGMEFGKVVRDANDKRTVANWGCCCERCKGEEVDSILYFDGSAWGVCRNCREDAIKDFNAYMYPDKDGGNNV